MQKLIDKLLHSYKTQTIVYLFKSVLSFRKPRNLNNEPIVIVLAANDSYMMMLTVTVKSLLLNYHAPNQLVFYIIEDQISRAHKDKFLRSLDTSVQILWLTLDEIFSRNYPLLGAFRELPTTYYRLLIPYIVPSNLKKVIYLDSDLVVNKDISFLWNMDFMGNVVLAVQDTRFPLIKDIIDNYEELGLNPKAKYFNAGVLLINLVQWRELEISEKVLEYTRRYKDFVVFDDQYGLNAALYQRWKCINSNWNLFPEFFPARPYILHYVSVKPSSPHYVNSNKHFFFHYLDKTEWRGWRPR
jgi:lipopolysaccharide biosynthesis glycosyltransferase